MSRLSTRPAVVLAFQSTISGVALNNFRGRGWIGGVEKCSNTYLLVTVTAARTTSNIRHKKCETIILASRRSCSLIDVPTEVSATTDNSVHLLRWVSMSLKTVLISSQGASKHLCFRITIWISSVQISGT